MWRLPGYVGVCQSSRYHRDVVAAMVPISGEGFPGDGQSGPHPLLVRAAKDVAPHWSVTFWVHDADAVAARAAELGGEVVSSPYDFAPGARAAVVADPQGATLTVGQPPPGP
jgi:predicted enzyme related to lactoylglutathione lyase